MTDHTTECLRPDFHPGGGDSFLSYVVYGPVSSEISRDQYRCSGIPEGIEIMSYGPNAHHEVLNSFREVYFWEELSRENGTLARLVTA